MLLLHRALAAVGGAAAGGGFDPADLTGIIAVFDPSDLTSLYEERTGGGSTQSSVNGVVGTMRDLSGNGNHLVAPSDAARPILRNSGGLYYLEFDGSDDYMGVTTTVSQPWVRVSGLSVRTGVSINDQVYGGVTANAGAFYAASGTTTWGIFDGSVGPTITLTVDTALVVTERHNNTNSRIAKDAGSYANGTSGSTSPGGIRIGANNSAGAIPPIYLYAYIQAASDLSDADITECRQWCADRAGVTL